MADLIKRDSALKGYDTVLSILNNAINAVSEAKAIVLQYGSEPEPQSPCDLCVHNPPSSMDGKPCCMCVAEPWRGEEHENQSERISKG